MTTARILLTAALALGAVGGQAATDDDSELRFIVILSRHGVRSPTAPNEQLNRYSAEPWPDWGVAPGQLTPHGRDLMKIVGAWDRAYLAREGVLPAAGCEGTDRVFAYSDADNRSRQSAAALLDAMLPGCGAAVQSRPPGEIDPLFDPFDSDIGPPDQALAAAAVLGQIGGRPEALRDVYRASFEELQRILGKPSVVPERISVRSGQGNAAVDIVGALRTASSLAENLLLEYLNGFSGKELGWGRLTPANLQTVMQLHVAYADLARRTPYIARARGSNLMSRILASLQQAQGGKPVKGAMGKAGDRLLLLMGHDVNASNIAGMLAINWLLPGDQPGDPVPGGALVFELRRSRSTGQDFVRTYYTAQSRDQMRDATPLSADTPPLRSPIFIPACGAAASDFRCEWPAFAQAVENAIDRKFVR